ncbi:hypothetical protein [Massilia consociata]|uniref:Uncharacterized protein n=1 Tax=Massilia consociata TaxID=760117 RepID=A0ABV6FKW9_9BURK
MNIAYPLLSAFTVLAAIFAASPAFAQVATPAASTAPITHRCDSSPAGQCWYVLYTSACREGPAKNGRPSLVCTKEFLTEFSLKVGESKTLAHAPAGTRHCPVGRDKPVFPDCAH